MSRHTPFSLVLRGTLTTCLFLSAAACTGVASLDPPIGPGEAIFVPKLLGDWVNLQDEDQDPATVHIMRGEDSTSYILEMSKPTIIIGSVSLGRPRMSARVAPAGGALLAEAIPSPTDSLFTSLRGPYGTMVHLAYMVGVVKFVGDDLQLSVLEGSSVRAALDSARCPPPGRVIEEEGDLLFTGDSRQLRRTIDCLIATPGALDTTNLFRRYHSR